MRKVIKDIATPKDFIDPDQNYLGYIDFALAGITERVLTIKSVQVDEVPVQGTGRVEKKPVVVFNETEKVLILNSTNKKMLVGLFGQLKNWAGNKIKIFADPSIKFGKKQTGGLVIKGADK